MPRLNFAAWFWMDNGGRIFSSALNRLVVSYDPSYVAFLNAGNKASPWPTDANGRQTAAALQAVLNVYLPLYVINPTITP